MLEDGVERVAITDFGLARAVDDATMTRSGVIAGTPQYMSPEQARGEVIDQRSDLFSLGSVMYTMCAGRAPFRAETTFGVLRRITDDEPTRLCEINSEVPDWLARLIERLMAKEVGDRYESAAEVAAVLEECLAHLQQPQAVPLPQSVSQTKSRSGRDWPPLKKLVAVAGGAFGLILAAVVIVLELNKGTLIIECEADDIPVQIMKGDRIYDQLTVSRSGASIQVSAGQYVVRMESPVDGILVRDESVTIRRGEKEVVRIRLTKASESDSADASFEKSAAATLQLMELISKDGPPWVATTYHLHADQRPVFQRRSVTEGVTTIEFKGTPKAPDAKFKARLLLPRFSRRGADFVARNEVRMWISEKELVEVSEGRRFVRAFYAPSGETTNSRQRLNSATLTDDDHQTQWLENVRTLGDLIAVLEVTRASEASTPERAAARLRGKWILESAEQFGEVAAARDQNAETQFGLVIKGNTLSGCFDAPFETVDWRIYQRGAEPDVYLQLQNPDESAAVQKRALRFRFRGDDTLQLCFDRHNPDQLPDKFHTQRGTGLVIWTLSRKPIAESTDFSPADESSMTATEIDSAATLEAVSQIGGPASNFDDLKGGVASSVQLLIRGPEGATLSGIATKNMEPLTLPARTNLSAAKEYRLKLSNIPQRAGIDIFPVIHVAGVTKSTKAFLDHNAVAIEITEEDLEQAISGHLVTKVVYLPDPEFSTTAVAGIETLVTSRLDPGVDPVTEADRRGAILAVLRIGNRVNLYQQTGPVSGLDVAVPTLNYPRASVEGAVTSVDQNRALISIGSDDSIRKGTTLMVFRDGDVLGKVEVTESNPDNAVGRILIQKPGNPIRSGDRAFFVNEGHQIIGNDPGESIYNDRLKRFKFRFEHVKLENSHEAAEEFWVRYRGNGYPKITGVWGDTKTNSIVVVGPPEADQPIRDTIARWEGDETGLDLEDDPAVTPQAMPPQPHEENDPADDPTESRQKPSAQDAGKPQEDDEQSILQQEFKIGDDLWQMLGDWDKARKRPHQLHGKLIRRIYDRTFETENIVSGEFWFESPDRLRVDFAPIEITPAMLSRRQKEDAVVERTKNGQAYALKSEISDVTRIICDGKQLTLISDHEKEAVVVTGHEVLGEHTINQWFPLMAGLNRTEIARRFIITMADKGNSDVTVRKLNLKPRLNSDEKHWNEVEVLLNTATFRLDAIRFVNSAKTLDTRYTFHDVAADKKKLILQDPNLENQWNPKLEGYDVHFDQQEPVTAAPVPQRPIYGGRDPRSGAMILNPNWAEPVYDMLSKAETLEIIDDDYDKMVRWRVQVSSRSDLRKLIGPVIALIGDTDPMWKPETEKTLLLATDADSVEIARKLLPLAMTALLNPQSPEETDPPEGDATDVAVLRFQVENLRSIGTTNLLSGEVHLFENARWFWDLSMSMEKEADLRENAAQHAEKSRVWKAEGKTAEALEEESAAETALLRADEIRVMRDAAEASRNQRQRDLDDAKILADKIHLLQEDGNVEDAKKLTKEMNALLRQHDPDRRLVLNLRRQIIDARANGDHDVADELETRRDDLLKKLDSRYGTESALEIDEPHSRSRDADL